MVLALAIKRQPFGCQGNSFEKEQIRRSSKPWRWICSFSTATQVATKGREEDMKFFIREKNTYIPSQTLPLGKGGLSRFAPWVVLIKVVNFR